MHIPLRPGEKNDRIYFGTFACASCAKKRARETNLNAYLFNKCRLIGKSQPAERAV